MTSRHRLRVAHVGTGLTGREALRGIINDPALELVAVLVSTPAKVGVDAGELCGIADVGVAATDDRAAVIEMAPDCVCYGATAVRREAAAIADMADFLRAGIDVVTFALIPMVYPSAAPVDWAGALGDAARTGGSTFYATGGEPGYISLNLPTALLAGAGVVDAYRMDEYALNLDVAYPIWDVLHESMGFGKPDGHVPARIASGKVTDDWSPVVRYVADTLGLTLDEVRLEWETLLAPQDLPLAIGSIGAGTICAHRWQLCGMVSGRQMVSVQYFATVSATPWPHIWPSPPEDGRGGMVIRVDGTPGMTLALGFHAVPGQVNPGVVATAMAAVNAVPAVVAAAPGIVGAPLAGPAVVTRQAVGRR